MNTIVLILAGLGGAAGVGLLLWDVLAADDIGRLLAWWRARREERRLTAPVRRRMRRLRRGR